MERVANPKKQVFKLQFAVGEFDMVVRDPATITCEIYEIKHSMDAREIRYTGTIKEARREFEGLKAQTADLEQDELTGARLALRPQQTFRRHITPRSAA